MHLKPCSWPYRDNSASQRGNTARLRGGGAIRASLQFEKKTEFLDESSKTIDIFGLFRTEVKPSGHNNVGGGGCRHDFSFAFIVLHILHSWDGWISLYWLDVIHMLITRCTTNGSVCHRLYCVELLSSYLRLKCILSQLTITRSKKHRESSSFSFCTFAQCFPCYGALSLLMATLVLCSLSLGWFFGWC